ncbi:MAG: hypothetical protein JKY65_08330 [Planctomycetes bacterium]|nr:hypothetical protein [Planctomycetota bacterium]
MFPRALRVARIPDGALSVSPDGLWALVGWQNGLAKLWRLLTPIDHPR